MYFPSVVLLVALFEQNPIYYYRGARIIYQVKVLKLFDVWTEFEHVFRLRYNIQVGENYA